MIEETAGKLLVEYSELGGLRRKEEWATAKASITRRADLGRTAYARVASEIPRQFVSLATTNEEKYLREGVDQGGLRRFWPVAILRPADIRALKNDRTQLFAEAVVMERALGDAITNVPPEFWPLEAAARAKRMDRRPSVDLLLPLFEAVDAGVVPVAEIRKAMDAMGLSNEYERVQKELRIAIREMGFSQPNSAVKVPGSGGAPARVFVKGDVKNVWWCVSSKPPHDYPRFIIDVEKTKAASGLGFAIGGVKRGVTVDLTPIREEASTGASEEESNEKEKHDAV